MQSSQAICCPGVKCKTCSLGVKFKLVRGHLGFLQDFKFKGEGRIRVELLENTDR